MSPLTATTTTGKEPTRRTSTTSLSCLKQAIGKGKGVSKGLRVMVVSGDGGKRKSESVKDAAAVS